MTEGHIYIDGLIGSTKDENGVITERGVELQDVIMKVEQLKGVEKIFAHINSEGGYVDVGEKIAEYFSKLPNIYTIAEGLCASMATEIHLSVPVERRSIVEGTKYLIHSPMYSLQRGISLNSDQLSEMSDSIGATETKMASMYAKATGLDKTALELLMKQETALTPEQCKEFGFVSSILPATSYKAVALFTPKQKSQTDNNMSKLIDEIKNLAGIVKTAMSGKQEPEKVAADPMIEACKQCIVECQVCVDAGVPDPCLAACKECINSCEAMIAGMTDETMAACVEACKKCIDACKPLLEDEKFKAIIEKCIAGCENCISVIGGDDKGMKAELEKIQAENIAIKAEFEVLKAEREAEKVALEELTADVKAMAKLTSTYKPVARAAAFRKVVEEAAAPGDGDEAKKIRDLRAARAAARKANQK